MLKQTLTIGILLILGLNLMAASPPVLDANEVRYQEDDGSQVVLFWVESAPAGTPAVLTAGPDYEQIIIPQRVLAQLPVHVRAAFQGDFTTAAAQKGTQ